MTKEIRQTFYHLGEEEAYEGIYRELGALVSSMLSEERQELRSALGEWEGLQNDLTNLSSQEQQERINTYVQQRTNPK